MRYTLLATLLCSCASAPTMWHHASKPAQQFYADSSECMAQAHQAIPVQQAQHQPGPHVRQPGWHDAAQQAAMNTQNAMAIDRANQQRDTMHEHCLRGRGWVPSR